MHEHLLDHLANKLRTGHDSARVPESKATSESREEDTTNKLDASVRRAVDSLPLLEREFTYLFYFQGQSYTKIARQLGISAKRAEKLHIRAKRRLRESLAGIDSAIN
jgi:RNA polymerase sigma factor (sigma-70 family)